MINTWGMPVINIVVPMAGRGSRFSDVGYKIPKPLIPVLNRPMIELVVKNLTPSQNHRFIFICQKAHIEQYGLDVALKTMSPECIIITVDTVTEGPACTVLLAKEWIDSADSLMIANCDQYVDQSIDAYLEQMHSQSLDGLIMTMTANHPKWSYVRFDENENICEVVEKVVVSTEATVGIYNYAKGSDFVSAAEAMISKNLRVNSEFYVAPAYNEMIAAGKKVGYFNIGSDRNGMYGLGVPEDLEFFLAHFNDKSI